jgi:hypothetical protein
MNEVNIPPFTGEMSLVTCSTASSSPFFPFVLQSIEVLLLAAE